MRKRIGVFIFFLAIWCGFSIGVFAEDEGPPYIVDYVKKNNTPLLFAKGSILTEGMLPRTMDVQVWGKNSAERPHVSQLPVTWHLDQFQAEIAGSINFILTGELTLPPEYEKSADLEGPRLQIIYREEGPITDLEGRYRGGVITLWFNRLTEEFPYYGAVPDAGRMWMQYSIDGAQWESEEIADHTASYQAQRLFDGDPVMIRLYVESGIQAGYSNTICLPYALTDNGQDGASDGGGSDDIGGNRGGGSAIIPMPEGKEPSDARNTSDGQLSGGVKEGAASGTDPSERDPSGGITPDGDSGSVKPAVKDGTEKKDAKTAKKDAKIEEKSGRGPRETAQSGLAPGTWIVGICLFILCIAVGTGVLKLAGYYKR